MRLADGKRERAAFSRNSHPAGDRIVECMKPFGHGGARHGDFVALAAVKRA